MFMSDVNDVKIYNLSAGKSLPDWLTDRRKLSQLKKKVDSRRQIELIQDFDMPGVSTSIRMSPDSQYIIATGTYKPRVKCFEVANLSIKFERCFDSEITCFEILSDDYCKMVFLQCDRYLEFHAAHGRHYRLRIPRFGRDMKYHKPNCDLIIVGTSKDIYRLNLERGQFLHPYETEGSCINACSINTEHNLICVGTQEGTIEAWDSRDRKRCSTLDVAINLPNTKDFPSITSMKFKNGLKIGVGTSSGHVLLYDIRSRNPLLIKDHLNKLPIKKIDFNSSVSKVYSMDSAMLKIWDENTGKQFAFIESISNFNDFCTIPKTGMFFIAQEDVKMLTYYIPSMGPAPKWCSFLDNLTEEIESEIVENIYDDYQFISQKDLEELGLEHLVGTNLLRAYMHGYFIDHRLYEKAKAIVEPFAFERYRKEKIRKELEAQRPNRIQFNNNLPTVNQDLAIKIMEETENGTQKSKNKLNLLEDKRFRAMFENTDFKIDQNAVEYKLLAPVLKRLEKSKINEIKRRIEVAKVHELHSEENQKKENSDNDDDLFDLVQNNTTSSSEDESSEDDAKDFSKEIKNVYKQVKRDRRNLSDDNEEEQKKIEKNENKILEIKSLANMVEVNVGQEFQINSYENKRNKRSLEDRVRKAENGPIVSSIGGKLGNKQMVFNTQKISRDTKKREFEVKKHREERKRLMRPTNSLKLKKVNFK